MKLLFLLPFFLLACGEKDEDTSNPNETDVDTDTDSDSDTDTTGCSEWTGISGVGTTWVYSMSSGGLTGSGTSQITAFEGSSSWTVETNFDLTGTIQGFYITTNIASTSKGFCDSQGLWMVSVYTVTTQTVAGQTNTFTSDITYDEPVLELPAELSVGVTWESHEKYTTQDPYTGQTISVDSTTNYEVVAEEEVSVPAGTFTAMKVSAQVRDTEGADPVSSWYAQGVGLVKTSSAESTLELTSYSN